MPGTGPPGGYIHPGEEVLHALLQTPPPDVFLSQQTENEASLL